MLPKGDCINSNFHDKREREREREKGEKIQERMKEKRVSIRVLTSGQFVTTIITLSEPAVKFLGNGPFFSPPPFVKG